MPLFEANAGKNKEAAVGKRGEGRYKRISWDEALDEIAKRLKPLREEGRVAIDDRRVVHEAQQRIGDERSEGGDGEGGDGRVVARAAPERGSHAGGGVLSGYRQRSAISHSQHRGLRASQVSRPNWM